MPTGLPSAASGQQTTLIESQGNGGANPSGGVIASPTGNALATPFQVPVLSLTGAPSNVGSASDLEDAIKRRFDAVMDNVDNFVPPARGHLALVVIAEISFILADEFEADLPLLLHHAFLGLDNSSALVVENCRTLLQNFLTSMVLQRMRPNAEDNFTDSETHRECFDLLEYLKSKEERVFWAREDISLHKPHINSAYYLTNVVQKYVGVMEDAVPSFKDAKLREKWAHEALNWATGCPVMHWRCRSLQIYRSLKTAPDREKVLDALNILSRSLYAAPPDRSEMTKSDSLTERDKNFGFVLEIIYTLQAMVDCMDTNRLMFVHQIFWAGVALLYTDFEEMFQAAVILLIKIIDKIDFEDKHVQSVFVTCKPKIPSLNRLGIQPLVLRGLLSARTEPRSVELLSKLTSIPLDDVIQPHPTRFITNMLSLLPWLCHNLSDDSSQI